MKEVMKFQEVFNMPRCAAYKNTSPNIFLMKLILSLVLMSGFSLSALAKPNIIGKGQAPINPHDYETLEEIAINAKIPIEKFRHYKRNHYIVGEDGFLYWDEEKNGVVDGDDSPVFGTVVRSKNTYITDENGYVVGITIKNSMFNNMDILNKFKKIIAINLSNNNVGDINLYNLPELRFLNIFERNNLRTLTQVKNLKNLTVFIINGLNTPNFKKFTGVENLRKIDISGMGIESFDGLENMPNLKEAEISANGKGTAKNFKSLSGIPKGHKLEKLKLSSAATINIQGIANFSHLKQLELWANQKALNDLTPLSTLKELEELELTVLGINDFSFLRDMPKLKQVITYNTPITSLEGLDEAPNLEVLELHHGKLATIEHLDGNTQLKTLVLNDQAISRVRGLRSLKKLKILDLSLNKIQKIEGLDDNLCLEKIWFAANPINTFENLDHLPLFSDLDIGRTKVSAFPNWQNLKRLHNLSVDIDNLDKGKFAKNYFYRSIPLKDFDMQLRQAKPITNEERKQYGCI
jgi:hypothetical protein